MVRFNGYGLHATDYVRTRDWIARLRVWQARGLERVYFFQHQHEPANSLDMMVYMVKEWNEGGEPLLNLPRLTPPNAQQSLF